MVKETMTADIKINKVARIVRALNAPKSKAKRIEAMYGEPLNFPNILEAIQFSQITQQTLLNETVN